MYKALFVAHTSDNYGASQSLRLLLKNYTNLEAHIVVRKSLFKKLDHSLLKERFGDSVSFIAAYFLPFSQSYIGRHTGIKYYKILLRNLLWYFNKNKFYEMVETNNYDFVYLNSHVLHTIIKKNRNYFVHVRDIFDNKDNRVLYSLEKAKGVIFIDNTTFESFDRLNNKNKIILNNPFDMTGLNNYKEDIGFSFDFKNKIIISLIGLINTAKGADFIINAVLKSHNKKLLLLLVGKGDLDLIEKYKKICKNSSQIFFYGEEEDIFKIYKISDYIIRGDAMPCIGRTVYEGLYAGCKVVIPGFNDKTSFIFDYQKYSDRIYLYPPRNEEELIQILNGVSDKVVDKKYESNVPAYIKAHKLFISSILRK